ncbi:MAG: YgiQ family radical SAM protein [Bacteroidetes bacterium]|nr:YgiQ family radical SAM protein [Bacteroidota bacterium]MBT6686294.1 YgiQ family radical SAM protein [Bacteroidota bacterium]MBT7145096.1 YgiQ family radical SAM protein [Bacteroidota bacterium]MBT7490186.1 YgiQ family radical SAM protein [Bacteroidota bacterium]
MKKETKKNSWLPLSKKEAEQRAWNELDIILFSGDAYIDHPSFGVGLIGRVLEKQGFKVAIVAQPNWQDDLRDFKKFGKPRLFFGVSSGNMDSMVNHYTANLRLRSTDAYTPNNKAGFRPDRATTVYSQILRKIYPDSPIIIGGIEASLRRLTHYDYWSNKLRPSILAESNADLLVYGMGEKPIKEIAKLLDKGIKISEIRNTQQTAFLSEKENIISDKRWENITLNSHKECLKSKLSFAKNFKIIEIESNKLYSNSRLIQQIDEKMIVVNPAYSNLTEKELDEIYQLPFTSLPHPKYNKRGKIPAFEMIKFSVNSHRGCFGGCSFCTISAHQGKFISSRSEKSILNEIDMIAEMPEFKGHLSDIGGPSANMYKMAGIDLSICEKCKRPSCIFPSICNNLETNHENLLNIYRKAKNHPKVKKATIGSGIRYDLFFNKETKNYTKSAYNYLIELIKEHVSGRLKVAPEHVSDKVLKTMRKPSFNLFLKLKKTFDEINKKHNLKQQIIPYFISSHPTSERSDMASLASKTKELNFQLEQVQDFTPTPMTLATVMFYSGYDPYSLKKVYTAKSKSEKLAQRDYFFWYKKGRNK